MADLRTLMENAGLGSTFSKMSMSALRKAIDKASSSGDPSIKRGRDTASVDFLRSILAEVDNAKSDRPIVHSTVSVQTQTATSKELITLPEAAVASKASAVEQAAETHNETGHEHDRAAVQDSSALPVSGVQATGTQETFVQMVEKQAKQDVAGTPNAPTTPADEHIGSSQTAAFNVTVYTSDHPATQQRQCTQSESPKADTGAIRQKVTDLGSAVGSGEAVQIIGAKRKASDQEAETLRSSVETDSTDETGETKRRKLHDEKLQMERRERAKKYAVNRANKASTWLSERVKDRVAGRKPDDERAPRNLIQEAVHTNYGNHVYKGALQQLSTEKPNAHQLQKLEHAGCMGPNYLGRTASMSGGFRFDIMKSSTNGFTTQTLMMPAADAHADQGMRAGIQDIPQGLLVYMGGHHLMWSDLSGDQLLSQTNDPLFMVTHALCRAHQNQSGTTLQFIDRRLAKDVNGQPAVFYPALDFYDAFRIPVSPIWNMPAIIKLHPRKFTQEYLTHHMIRIEDTRFQQAPIEKLIEDGLHDIFPAFEVPEDHLRSGLYTSQVVFRKVGYPPDAAALREKQIYSYDACATSTPVTVEFLGLVQKVTRNFMMIDKNTDRDTVEPHLHIFLCFLTFQKRPSNDSVLAEWLLAHYTKADVTDLYGDDEGGVRPGFTHVADNLPGVMQYLDLIRDACAVFGLPPIPANVVETHNAMTGKEYANEDDRRHKNDVASRPYDRDKQLDDRDKSAGRRRNKRAEANRRKSLEFSGNNTLESQSSVDNTTTGDATNGESAGATNDEGVNVAEDEAVGSANDGAEDGGIDEDDA